MRRCHYDSYSTTCNNRTNVIIWLHTINYILFPSFRTEEDIVTTFMLQSITMVLLFGTILFVQQLIKNLYPVKTTMSLECSVSLLTSFSLSSLKIGVAITITSAVAVSMLYPKTG